MLARKRKPLSCFRRRPTTVSRRCVCSAFSCVTQRGGLPPAGIRRREANLRAEGTVTGEASCPAKVDITQVPALTPPYLPLKGGIRDP